MLYKEWRYCYSFHRLCVSENFEMKLSSARTATPQHSTDESRDDTQGMCRTCDHSDGTRLCGTQQRKVIFR